MTDDQLDALIADLTAATAELDALIARLSRAREELAALINAGGVAWRVLLDDDGEELAPPAAFYAHEDMRP